MNRKVLCALLAMLAVAPLGCNRKNEPTASPAAGEPARLASTVRTGDPRAERQLLSGFYSIENNAWRWTHRKFEVELGVPAGAAAKGAVLECNFSVPPVSIQKLKSQTLSVSVAGTPLKPANLNTAGLFTYSREIPASLLTGASVKVAFELDKAHPPDGADARELGVVASAFTLK